jgi:carboxymethylenebutenolidase
MSSRWDTVQTPDGPMPVYVTTPAGANALATVVVIQHAGGVDDFVRTMADRLTDDGFVAVAPDLYHREEADSKDDPMTRMMRLRDATVASDVNAAVEHAKTLAEVDGDRLGITGFCMGGRVTWLMAAKSDAFKAGVICWGGNIMVPWGDSPAPFDLAGDITCPMLGLFGEEDPNPNPADVAKLDAELDRVGVRHEFHSYPSAGHAFMNESRPSYREEATKDGWARLVDWFDAHLRG